MLRQRRSLTRGDDAQDRSRPKDGRRYGVEQDGQVGIDQSVAEEQSAEQQVASGSQRPNPLGVLDLFWIRGAIDYDLKIIVRERHQTQVQAREEAAQ